MTPSPPSTQSTPSPPSTDTSTARSAGRGGLAIAGAKVSFILFGFAQQLLLSNLLGADGYGEVSRVLAVVGIFNNVVVATSIQGVSRAVSSAPSNRADEAFRRTLKIHTLVAIVASAAFALLAGFIADAVGAPHITTPLRAVALVILLYGVYAPLVGSLNGKRRFLDQAGLDVGYGALRTMGIACGALLFMRGGHSGVIGAILGFIVAAALIIPAALSRAGIGAPAAASTNASPRVEDYLRFLVTLAGGQIFLNLLLQTDFMLLSRFAGVAAERAGQGADGADKLVAVYRGTQLFAFLPYQMLMSITFILFPMLARAHTESDATAIKNYTKMGVRLAFLMTGLLCGTVAALAPHLLRFAFPRDIWEHGGAALRVLSLGMGAFAILGITCAALTSLGREGSAASLTAGAVGLVASACYAFVPSATFGEGMLVASASATSVALGIAAVLGGARLRVVAGGFVDLLTLLRVAAATAITIVLGSMIPWMGKLLVPAQALAVAAIYAAILIVTREVGKADLALIRRAFGRRA